MIKSKYKKIISCPISDEMFEIIKAITDEEEISYSAFIRKCIRNEVRRLDDE